MGAKSSVLRKMVYCIGIMAVLHGNPIFAGPTADGISGEEIVTKERSLDKIEAVELTLKNGLRVCLKPTKSSSDDVVVRMLAPGGFAAFSESERASAELAPSVAWESGMGTSSADQLAILLDDHDLEFTPQIGPFSRVLEGATTAAEVETLLRLINLFYTQSNFDREAFELVMRKSQLQAVDRPASFEEALVAYNTDHFWPLKPLSAQAIRQASFSQSKELFEAAFSDPSEFVCVIVGNFDPNAIKDSILKYLGTLSSKSDGANPFQAKVPKAAFPPGVKMNRVQVTPQKVTRSSLTFPVLTKIDVDTLPQMDDLAHVIKARLDGVSKGRVDTIDVIFQLPCHPDLQTAWLTIQYCHQSTNDKEAATLKDLLLTELELLQKEGPSGKEITVAQGMKMIGAQSYLRKDCCWLNLLASYYVWGWDPELLADYGKKPLLLDEVAAHLKNSISLGNYSSLTTEN